MLDNLRNKFANFSVDHMPEILTAIGVAGSVSATFLTGKASFRAYSLLEKEERARELNSQPPMSTWDKIGFVYDLYIPAAASGLIGVTAIVLSNRVSNRRTAAIVAAYSIADKAFDEYKEKVKDRMGANKERDLRDEIAQDRVREHPIADSYIVGDGRVPFFDAYTGRYFTSTMEAVRQSVNELNHQIIHNQYASLSELYSMIGLPPTAFSDDVGWNSDNLLEVDYTATLTDDGRPCVVLTFRVHPIRGFGKAY